MLGFVPQGPEWTVDYDAMTAEYDWVPAREVVEALVAREDYRALDAAARAELFAALMCSPLGASRTRQLLWERGADFEARERVARLLQPRELTLQTPHVIRLSHSVRCDYLAMLHEVRGTDPAWVERFRDACREAYCLDRPRVFDTDHARFYYFQCGGTNPYYVPHEDFRCDVVMLSGLPGAGKDTWIEKERGGWPVVSLDRIRSRLKIKPTDNQGRVIQDAREAAREHLRARRNFVWNATNLSRRIRRQVISLFADYDARVHIVYIEVPSDVLWARNKKRRDGLPRKDMEGLFARWETPELAEAHSVEWIV